MLAAKRTARDKVPGRELDARRRAGDDVLALAGRDRNRAPERDRLAE